MSNLQSVKEVVDRITSGAVDNHLDVILDAVQMRRDSINSTKMLFLRRGDLVRFNNQTRPKYLQGLTAEIVRANKTTVTVKMTEEDKFAARKYGFGQFRTPLSLVDKVEV